MTTTTKAKEVLGAGESSAVTEHCNADTDADFDADAGHHARNDGLVVPAEKEACNSGGSKPALLERDEKHFDGWGFHDCRLDLGSDGIVRLAGKRYAEMFPAGQREFPAFADWAETALGLDLDDPRPHVERPDPAKYPPAVRNDAFLSAMRVYEDIEFTEDLDARVRRSHGQSVQEVYALRFKEVVPWRVPDVVVFPKSHEAVEAVLAAADKHGCVVVPVGGCSSVTQAVQLDRESEGAPKCVIALDMRSMRRIKWIDRDNMCACIEAGAYGREIEEKLGRLGLTMGHEPDSLEFSTLGGWIATKSSGMKKNTYGNIEDIVLNLKLATPALGTLTRVSNFERESVGPDPVKLAIGSEGILGVVTEAVVRLRLRASHQTFDSYLFSNFRSGQEAMRELALLRAAPASVRLMDNAQFQMGQALKGPLGTGHVAALVDRAQKFYVLEYHQMDPEKMCAMTLSYEGFGASQVRESMRQVDRICKRHGGVRAGAESARRGYNLTWMIAYLRDFGLDYGFMSESFETTVPWTEVATLYECVCACIRKEVAAAGLDEPLVGGRITQTYDTCCAMYFYFGINMQDLGDEGCEEKGEDPVALFSRIEDAARREVLRCGGSLSHHHGVGKIRLPFYREVTGSGARQLLTALKTLVDPRNVLAAGNLSALPPPAKL
ncbi:Alkyldihydroxyacetonephosphate synthase, peroxisomal [Hondaea fermentalgiana]|uniref:Alkylglycerone-phosphate synthase n=1 Tax=Hondaea fermentalgiana TaxID=2315210 RepID=A0A2R5GQZ5_9STRA|nr:Alkyldihydroxyacetonephosphate synthase, peroxisomal [Hondaea fermentalgiana]|eukprot:GBG30304.1 Alkyldihydroxyacetonephosphate synthase, peroxisomal [Hondaea fermentalgiana]